MRDHETCSTSTTDNTHRSEGYACGVTSGQDVVNVVHANDPVGDEVWVLGLSLKASGQEVPFLVIDALLFGRESFFHPFDRELDDRVSWREG